MEIQVFGTIERLKTELLKFCKLSPKTVSLKFALIFLQTEMTTRAELAFKALDKDNSGYITGIYTVHGSGII